MHHNWLVSNLLDEESNHVTTSMKVNTRNKEVTQWLLCGIMDKAHANK